MIKLVILHLTLIKIDWDKIQEAMVSMGPMKESRKGGHGLIMDNNTMYAENKDATENSIEICLTLTSYDQIDKNIAIGIKIKPLY